MSVSFFDSLQIVHYAAFYNHFLDFFLQFDVKNYVKIKKKKNVRKTHLNNDWLT